MPKVWIAVSLLLLLVLSSSDVTLASGECVFQGRRGAVSYYSCPLGKFPPLAAWGFARSREPLHRTTPEPHRPSAVKGIQRPIVEFVRETAERYQISPRLIEAMIAVESGWNPRAISPKGAKGLMQLIPETAQRYGVRDPFDPRANVEGGIRYLRDLLNEFRDLRLALAAYNAGEEAVRKYGSIPPYPETQAYVREVMRRYQG